MGSDSQSYTYKVPATPLVYWPNIQLGTPLSKSYVQPDSLPHEPKPQAPYTPAPITQPFVPTQLPPKPTHKRFISPVSGKPIKAKPQSSTIHCATCKTVHIVTQDMPLIQRRLNTLYCPYVNPTLKPNNNRLEATLTDAYSHYALKMNTSYKFAKFLTHDDRTIFDTPKYNRPYKDSSLNGHTHVAPKPYATYNKYLHNTDNTQYAEDAMRDQVTFGECHIKMGCLSCGSTVTLLVNSETVRTQHPYTPTRCVFCGSSHTQITQASTEEFAYNILSIKYQLDDPDYARYLYTAWIIHYTQYNTFNAFFKDLPTIFASEVNQMQAEISQ